MSVARSKPGWTGTLIIVAVLTMVASGARSLGDDSLAQARAAEARLDFRTAYSLFETAVTLAPDNAAPYLARAGLHRKLDRPALALADLDRARRLAPDNPEPFVASAEIWLENTALRTAIRAFDAALERAPNHRRALAGRARAHARAGLIGNALADYDRALSLAPDDDALTAERAALIEARAARRVAEISYDPGALMAPEFRIENGVPGAADRLVIIEAGNELVAAGEGLDPVALAGAIEDGALQLTRVFTYTGQDSAIWANLALICGGREAQADVRAALTAGEGRAALDTIDAFGDPAPLKALVGEAYAQAGLDNTRLEACAFNRGQALRYLAEWTDKHEGHAWKGVNFYDFWPVYIWNDTPTTLGQVNALLAQKLPADTDARAPQEPQAARAQEAVEDSGGNPPPGELYGPRDDEAERAPPEGEVPLAPDAEAGDPRPAEAPETVLDSAARLAAPVTAEGRVPVELRGIYAPGLVACLAYTAQREAATALDEILPALNPLDGPVIGTVLLASQRLHLFNATSTECGLAALPETEPGSPWRGGFSCANALAPDVITPLDLVRVDNDGPAPQLEARLGATEPVTLIQCRPFGLLGRDAAPLWNFDENECRLRAPVGGTAFEFHAGAEGRLVLQVSPDGPLTDATPPQLGLDGVGWGTGAPAREGLAWRFDLGAFPVASERLGRGLFLDLTGAEGGAALRLPLLGSSAAMARLATCAPTTEQGDNG